MKNKKLTAFIFMVTALFLTSSVYANEVSAVWERLYNKAQSLSQKYNIMVNIVEQHDRDMIPVLEKALDEQVSAMENQRTITDQLKSDSFTKLVVKELGRLKDREAAPLIWDVVDNSDDPFVKGEAIIALGRVGAKDYSNKLNLMLRNINMNYGNIQDQRKNEIVAYALVMALEKLKSPDSYSPLFFAANGWYSRKSGVKEKASKALLTIVDDPADQLIGIIKDSKDFGLKLAGLEAGVISRASEENKARLAVTALDQGLINSPQSVVQKQQLKSLRVRALEVLEENGAKPESATPLMKSMLIKYQTERLVDEDEMVQLFETAGTYHSDAVGTILSEFLAYLTDRKESGGTVSFRISKSVVIAMGNNGSKVCFEELTRAQYSDSWENSIKREAKNAVQKLNK